LPIAVFNQSINQLSLVSINQSEKISDSFFSPMGTDTISSRLCFRGMHRRAAFDSLRQLKRCLSGFAIYRRVTYPDSVCHVSYLHHRTILERKNSIVKEKMHHGIYSQRMA